MILEPAISEYLPKLPNPEADPESIAPLSYFSIGPLLFYPLVAPHVTGSWLVRGFPEIRPLLYHLLDVIRTQTFHQQRPMIVDKLDRRFEQHSESDMA